MVERWVCRCACAYLSESMKVWLQHTFHICRTSLMLCLDKLIIHPKNGCSCSSTCKERGASQNPEPGSTLPRWPVRSDTFTLSTLFIGQNGTKLIHRNSDFYCWIFKMVIFGWFFSGIWNQKIFFWILRSVFEFIPAVFYYYFYWFFNNVIILVVWLKCGKKTTSCLCFFRDMWCWQTLVCAKKVWSLKEQPRLSAGLQKWV